MEPDELEAWVGGPSLSPDALARALARAGPAERARLAACQLRRCLGQLVGGSGHLTALVPLPGGLELGAGRPRADGTVEWPFRLRAARLSELGGEAAAALEAEGSLVLDPELRIALGPDGRVQLRPWRCLDPAIWLGEDYPPEARRLLAELAGD